jgi:xanthine dehydrogenase accessory factor
MSSVSLPGLRILIKGAGEMATGIAHRLYSSNIRHIMMTEIERPLTVRRTVAFSEAVYEGFAEVEGVVARLIEDAALIDQRWQAGEIGVIVDPSWQTIYTMRPHVVCDAIMAKKNLGSSNDEAPLVIGVGPGFRAPEDVHAAVESNRGHNLGRVIYRGSPEPHTGIPGDIMGRTAERVVRAPVAGKVAHLRRIGDQVDEGEEILAVGRFVVRSPLKGVLRGLIREIEVTEKEKIADVDPRGLPEHCYTITDKARAIGGGVLEAVLHFCNRE